MLNLNQVQSRLNPAHRTGEVYIMNDLYKALKALGWTSLDKVHPTDRVSLFQLGYATLRRAKNEQPGVWIVEVDGYDFRFVGTPEEVTAEAERLAALVNSEDILTEQVTNLFRQAKAHQVETETHETSDPRPLSPAALIAAELTSQHPKLAAKIEKALALAEAGTIEFDHYATGVMRETMTWRCDCPDATHRPQWTKGIGQTCKHTLAQYITYRVKRDLEQAGQRKLIDGIERERARRDQALPADVGTGRSILDMLGYDDALTVEQQKARAAASLGTALRPDYINRKASHSAQFRGIGHL